MIKELVTAGLMFLNTDGSVQEQINNPPTKCVGNIMSHKNITLNLIKDFKEKPVDFHLQDDGSVLELLASDNTWSIVYTDTNNISCIIRSGYYTKAEEQEI